MAILASRKGLTGSTSGKEQAYQCRRQKTCGFDPWVGKIPWKREWQPTIALLPGKFHGQRSLAGYSPWGHKEVDMTETTCTEYCFEMIFIQFIPHIVC